MFRLPILAFIAVFLVGCATSPSKRSSSSHRPASTQKVRTTAYTHCEKGGKRNAIGGRLSTGPVASAAADWSRFPLGTKFKVLQTGQVYQIDDYGSALVGTNTIDLYKPSRQSMRNWGVRHVDIQILQWGSRERSLQVLAPRTRTRYVREMVADLRSKG